MKCCGTDQYGDVVLEMVAPRMRFTDIGRLYEILRVSSTRYLQRQHNNSLRHHIRHAHSDDALQQRKQTDGEEQSKQL